MSERSRLNLIEPARSVLVDWIAVWSAHANIIAASRNPNGKGKEEVEPEDFSGGIC